MRVTRSGRELVPFDDVAEGQPLFILLEGRMKSAGRIRAHTDDADLASELVAGDLLSAFGAYHGAHMVVAGDVGVGVDHH